jgi:putative ABC transport system substrate-binding protein
MLHLSRREFITLLGGEAAAWPLAAKAQQSEQMRRIGVLMSYLESDGEAQEQTKAFSQSLKEFGWTDGVNIRLDYRWPGSDADRLRADALELVRLAPDVLLAGATPAVIALKQETRSIPIVFANVADPVGQRFVATLAQPGANISGFGAFEFSIAGKWVEAIKEIVPSATQIAVIFNPETAPFYGLFLPFIETAARRAGIKTNVTPIHDPADIAGTIDKLAKESNGLIVLPGARFTAARRVIITTAAQLRLPAVYPYSYYARSGGLISYGFDASDMYRRAASYVDRILRGAKPADLPVQQPTKFELVINFKTAKALGIDVPPTLLARADEVIE